MDNDTWKKEYRDWGSYEKQDAWKAQLIFTYQFWGPFREPCRPVPRDRPFSWTGRKIPRAFRAEARENPCLVK